LEIVCPLISYHRNRWTAYYKVSKWGYSLPYTGSTSALDYQVQSTQWAAKSHVIVPCYPLVSRQFQSSSRVSSWKDDIIALVSQSRSSSAKLIYSPCARCYSGFLLKLLPSWVEFREEFCYYLRLSTRSSRKA
jgi:hypothetical protein